MKKKLLTRWNPSAVRTNQIKSGNKCSKYKHQYLVKYISNFSVITLILYQGNYLEDWVGIWLISPYFHAPDYIILPVFLSINYNAASTDFPLLSIPDTRHLTRLTIQTVLFRFSKLSRETEHLTQTQQFIFLHAVFCIWKKWVFLKKCLCNLMV